MSRQILLVFVAACHVLALGLCWLAQRISDEGEKRAVLCRQGAEARAYLLGHSQEIEEARCRLSQWEERTSGAAETRLVDAVSRFQRRRDDFRLVGLIQAPEGILVEAECRSQAAIEFLVFCDRDLLDLAPARISLGCPPGTRVGSLRAEITFRRLTRSFAASAVAAQRSAEVPPPPVMPHLRAASLEVRR